MKRTLSLLVSLLPALCLARDIPELTVPAGVGVNIHFVTGHEKDLDLIAAAGFRFIRMDFGWASIERTKGEYDWTAYEQLLANLDQRGMRAVFILDYSNPLYEAQVTSTNPLTHELHQTIASPQHPESVAAYAAWAAAATRHFHGRHVLWELWNEPNIDFWSPKPDVGQYSTLALAACKAIRQVEPDATIVGPASSGFPWDFLEAFLKSGVLGYLDAVSVHPYREPKKPPETAAVDYARLKGLIERYSPPAKRQTIQILSGEWGYSSWQRGVSLETQADFAVRQQLVNLLNGVPLSIWYDWKNDGADPKENEHNFGTMTPDLKPKPAYTALRTFTRELSGYRVIRRMPLPLEQDFLLICGNPAGKQKLAAWTVGESHAVSIIITGDLKEMAGSLRDGESFTPELAEGRCRLDLASAPKYFTIGSANVK